ncbi:MAG: hypothetical protein LBM27_00985 [Lactobacillaceae bacterium]|jgi:predicted DNA-binding protein YlxM (UPF0122 family)|nr:hypothetical protein [Lactobacillaceae bacterium]
MDISEKQTYAELFGTYESILPDKLRSYLDDTLISDLSFSEIAENAGITKQAVSNQIKRGLAELDRYEEKLQLVNSYRKRRDLEDQILATGDLELVKKLIQLEEK